MKPWSLGLLAPILLAASPLPDADKARTFLQCEEAWAGDAVPLDMIDERRRGKAVDLLEFRLPPDFTVFGLPVHSAYAWFFYEASGLKRLFDGPIDYNRVTLVNANFGATASKIIKTVGATEADIEGSPEGVITVRQSRLRKGAPDILIVADGLDRATITCLEAPDG